MRELHGATASRLYGIWEGMKARRQNPNAAKFELYGGRGIAVCERWQSFTNFRDDVGEPPTHKHTLDRRNVEGDYEPGNWRWATRREQACNRRNTIWAEVDGVRMCLLDAARLRGMNYATVRDRIKRFGWSVDRALNTPPIPKAGLTRDAKSRFAAAPISASVGPALERAR